MIDYIKFTVDGKTYDLIDNEDGAWSKSLNSPSIVGRYDLLLEVSKDGVVSYIDSTDPRYDFYLDVILSAERVIYLQNYVPEFMRELEEFKRIYDVENIEFDKLYADIEKIKSDAFVSTASNDGIVRLENFMRVKGQGNLEQRKSYLISLLQKGSKLSENIIRDITNTIAGSDCMIMFFGANELDNPDPSKGLLRVQVLSPDNQKDYKYDDIARTLKPLIPSHIKLLIIKFFATWGDIKVNFTDWNTVKSMSNWEAVKSYIPPQ